MWVTTPISIAHICAAANCYVAHSAHYMRIYIRTFKFDLLLHSATVNQVGLFIWFRCQIGCSATVSFLSWCFLRNCFRWFFSPALSLLFPLGIWFDVRNEIWNDPDCNQFECKNAVFISSKEPERERENETDLISSPSFFPAFDEA